MVAPVARQVGQADQIPALQFTQAGAHIGACHPQRVGNLLGVHGPALDVQQGVDLGDGAVDAPAGAHFAPMQNEA